MTARVFAVTRERTLMENQTCKTVLLSDEPASTDWFGSHDKLAIALADLISNEPGGRAIALTGSWGSGKSSTVKFFSEKLDKRTRVFVFNAWNHQGDPLRRTFLEQLTDYLENESWLSSASEWSKKKDKLAGRRTTQNTISTPLLNPYGKLLVVSLLLTPIGLAMFSRLGVEKVPDWLPKLGAWLASAPLLCLVLVLIAYLVSLGLRKAGVTTKVDWFDRFLGWSDKRLDIFAVLLNKSTTETDSETVESGQPTSIEFQKYFNELMNDALCGNTNKLVIVIDNLDRIDPEDALALWSTMTTFFDFGPKTNCPWLTSLWLIVPFDPTALSRLWPEPIQKNLEEQKDGENNSKGLAFKSDDLARVFVDKTFATAFHVPPPVRSDWRTYLVDQLAKALPDHAERGEDEFHSVYRIYQLGGLSQNRSPTPREIKIFVNKLGAIHRQRRDEIKLPLQALYVVLSNRTWDLEEKLRAATDGELLGSIPLGLVGSEWRTALAAIHFNAPRDKALQLLLGTKTEKALLSGEPDKLKEFEKISGITQVIEDVVGGNAAEWAANETVSLALAARALSGSGLADDSSLIGSWRMICDAARLVTSWTRISSEVGEGIVNILQHCKQEEFAKKIADSLGKSNIESAKEDAEPEADNIKAWLPGVARVLKAIQSEFPNVLQNFSVPGSASTFIGVMSELENNSETREVAEFFAPSVAPKAVVDELIKISSEEKFDEESANAILCMLSTKSEWPWNKLVEQLKARLNAENNLNVSEVKASLFTLIRLRSSQPAATKALTFLAQQGHLEHQLYQCDQAKDEKAVALCMLPIMEIIPDGAPVQSPGNASNGEIVYKEFIGNPASRPELITELAGIISDFGKTQTLVDLAKKNETKGLAHETLKQLASGPQAGKRLAPQVIIDDYEVLQAACEQSALDVLIKQSVADASLIDELIERGFKTELSALYVAVLRSDKANSVLLDFLESGLRGLDKEAWASELDSRGELVTLVIELVRAGRALDLGIPFQDALHSHAKNLLEGKVKIESLGEEWTEIIGALSGSSQETFFQRISELLYSEVPIDPILKVYGEQLLTNAVLVEQAERLVLNAFANFLSRGSIIELKWIARALRAKTNPLSKVKASIKKDFTSRISEAYKENQEKEDVRKEIAEIAELADVKLPRLEKKEENKE
jgi:Cdc6-like AAA superfamily ATPase